MTKTNSQIYAWRIEVVSKFDPSDFFCFIAFGKSLPSASKRVLQYFDRNFYRLGNCRICYSKEIYTMPSFNAICDCSHKID